MNMKKPQHRKTNSYFLDENKVDKAILVETQDAMQYDHQKKRINQLEMKATYKQYLGTKDIGKRGNSVVDKENRANQLNVVDKSKIVQELKKPQKSTKQMLKDQRIKENKDLNKNYGMSILESMYKGNVDKGCFLDRHDVTAKLRSKMVDWMVEVLCQYKCQEQTYFCAISIMDKYFQKVNRKVLIKELHEIGVTAMWIATKYEEIYPIRLQTLQDKIAHGKVTTSQMKNRETDIFNVLSFGIANNSVYEESVLLGELLNVKANFSQKNIEYYDKVITYLTKMVMYDYELLTSFSQKYLSMGILFVSFKIIEQIDSSFPTSNKIKEMVQLTRENEDKLYQVAQKVLNLAKNFETLYPNLENLKKFNGFQLNNKM